MAAGDISGSGVQIGSVSGVAMPGVGYGVWILRTAGGAPTPNDFRIGGARAVRGWWECPSPGFSYGSVTVVPGTPDHASAWADESLTPADAQRGADLANGTPATQPIFDVAEASLNGLPLIYSEADRGAYLESTHANVLPLPTGAYAVAAVGRAAPDAATTSGIVSWTYGSNDYERGPYKVGNDIYHRRNIGGVTSTAIWSGEGSRLTADAFWVLICNADASVDLWCNGVYLGNQTHAGFMAQTPTAFGVGKVSLFAGYDATLTAAAVALFAGAIPGADAAAKYAALKTGAGLDAMAARWEFSA